jgi:hypothetical protein
VISGGFPWQRDLKFWVITWGIPPGKAAVLVIRLSAANRQSLPELLELKLGESDYRIHLHPQDFETPDGWWPDRFFTRVRIPVPDRAGSHMVLPEEWREYPGSV